MISFVFDKVNKVREGAGDSAKGEMQLISETATTCFWPSTKESPEAQPPVGASPLSPGPFCPCSCPRDPPGVPLRSSPGHSAVPVRGEIEPGAVRGLRAALTQCDRE